MPMIEGSEWMVPHPQTMGELENNIRAIYKNMPPAAETDQPAYDLMFQAYRRIAGTEHMIQSNVMAAEMVRMETSTISRIAIRQFSLPGITMSAAEQVSYSDSWLPSGPQAPQIVPTVEVMLRGETPQYGYTELAVTRFETGGTTLQGETRDLYTLQAGEPQPPAEDEEGMDDVELTFRQVQAFIDRFPLSYVALINSLKPYR